MTIPMPAVDEDHNMERLFLEARKLSRGDFKLPNQPLDQRYIALITPGRHTASVHCPLPEKMTPAMISAVRAIVPEKQRQAVIVIADTRIPEHGKLSMREVAEHIPYLGYLLGIAYIGHTVVIFEGHPSALEAGCAGTDLLIVDEELLNSLQPDWHAVATSVMRRPRVLIATREGKFLEMDEPAVEPDSTEEESDNAHDEEPDIDFDPLAEDDEEEIK